MPSTWEIDVALGKRLFSRARAERWHLSRPDFERALQASAAKFFAGRSLDQKEVARFLESLHLEDLALACACAAGDDGAWEHFVREFRPLLYRSADAIDPGGSARELADSLYGDLFGVSEREGSRQSLFRYFHGRSSLATWLRAVLAQRHVDRLRSTRRLEPLPDEEPAANPASVSLDPDQRSRARLLEEALIRALSHISDKDRLRLGCYYGQSMTLAETGRVLREHEATVSRQLARTRKVLRAEVEAHLRTVARLSDAAIAECFESVLEDAGTLDLNALLPAGADCKNTIVDRSTNKRSE